MGLFYMSQDHAPIQTVLLCFLRAEFCHYSILPHWTNVRVCVCATCILCHFSVTHDSACPCRLCVSVWSTSCVFFSAHSDEHKRSSLTGARKARICTSWSKQNATVHFLSLSPPPHFSVCPLRKKQRLFSTWLLSVTLTERNWGSILVLFFFFFSWQQCAAMQKRGRAALCVILSSERRPAALGNPSCCSRSCFSWAQIWNKRGTFCPSHRLVTHSPSDSVEKTEPKFLSDDFEMWNESKSNFTRSVHQIQFKKVVVFCFSPNTQSTCL